MISYLFRKTLISLWQPVFQKKETALRFDPKQVIIQGYIKKNNKQTNVNSWKNFDYKPMRRKFPIESPVSRGKTQQSPWSSSEDEPSYFFTHPWARSATRCGAIPVVTFVLCLFETAIASPGLELRLENDRSCARNLDAGSKHDLPKKRKFNMQILPSFIFRVLFFRKSLFPQVNKLDYSKPAFFSFKDFSWYWQHFGIRNPGHVDQRKPVF